MMLFGYPSHGVTLIPRRIKITTELPGRTTAYRIAEVRPQVSGIIQKRLFTEGSDVREGQQLYQIDPATYQATYDSAQAALAKAQANLTIDRLTADRQKKLVDAHVISPQDYDNAFAALREAEADIGLNRASVKSAQINLNYTKVLAPISGRIGRSLVTEGALATNGQTTALPHFSAPTGEALTRPWRGPPGFCRSYGERGQGDCCGLKEESAKTKAIEVKVS